VINSLPCRTVAGKADVPTCRFSAISNERNIDEQECRECKAVSIFGTNVWCILGCHKMCVVIVLQRTHTCYTGVGTELTRTL
jgi:hypothetical protein